jgi:hypothetical protein
MKTKSNMTVSKDKLHKEVIKWLKEGMLLGDGWKIEITHRQGNKIESNRKIASEMMASNDVYDVLCWTFEEMLKELNVK